jgi:hypothetical protein
MLLHKDSQPEIFSDPFPHVVIDKALPETIYAELCRTMPPDHYLAGPMYKGPNRYHRRTAAELLTDDAVELSATWRRFLEHQLSPFFYQSCLSVFSGFLEDAEAVTRRANGVGLRDIQPAMRHLDNETDAQAWMECQISHVTPAEKPGSPLLPHVDREVALWAGLYYLQGVGPTEGGDLVLYRFREGRNREYWKDQMIPPSLVEPVKTIAALENRLVILLHGPNAVHGVTARRAGSSARQSVNLVCEFPFKVWDIAPWRRKLDCFPSAAD